ncbi:cytochrome c oxidase assembly protein COX16 homolog, mitochondrial isoform X1 [Mobula hypostoma]|uniref:cytochrome c oxidase assembly protein COX16 homolog, mitochondrial isoform X1 n=1 Tax=Mobula hypostoma TaxID=723540 RepID=UPI002FC38998
MAGETCACVLTTSSQAISWSLFDSSSDKAFCKLDPALEAQLKKNKDKVTLESEYQKLPKPNSEWVNIRGPRPWEDSKAVQEQQRKIQIGSSIK